MNKTNFETQYYHPTLRKKISFEIKSFLGRTFSSKIRKTKKEYLQLGSGHLEQNTIMENLDFYDITFKNFLGLKNFFKKKSYGHDLRYPLPFNDNLFKGVYSEHTLEHLYPFEAINLLKEINRVLITGGILRITVPDLDKYIDACYNKKSPFFSQYRNNCEMMWSLTQNYAHLSVWNFDMLKLQLEKCGFSNINKTELNKGIDSKLLIDKAGREPETLYVEAIK
jgi:hypothetical protein